MSRNHPREPLCRAARAAPWPVRLLAGVVAAVLVAALLAAPASPALAAAGAAALRQQEIATCEPGELRLWEDGRDRPAPGGRVPMVYRHAGAPPGFDEAMVLGAVQRAAQAWAGCGVPAPVLDEAAAPLHRAQLVVVQWSEAGSRGHFGLADLGQRTLSLGPGAFRLLAQRNPRHPAHQTLQMVLSHELGHFFGLMAHSRRCVDVMSYYDDGRGQTCTTRHGGSHQVLPEYRALLPTACDLARCRALNAAAPAAAR